ncbi:MAG: hypothetical protein OSB69_14950, partial [Alphaproteobacteria bacterium]|nr:hypothetical protein [Alphaproteobacteria bacterium]
MRAAEAFYVAPPTVVERCSFVVARDIPYVPFYVGDPVLIEILKEDKNMALVNEQVFLRSVDEAAQLIRLAR